MSDRLRIETSPNQRIKNPLNSQHNYLGGQRGQPYEKDSDYHATKRSKNHTWNSASE